MGFNRLPQCCLNKYTEVTFIDCCTLLWLYTCQPWRRWCLHSVRQCSSFDLWLFLNFLSSHTSLSSNLSLLYYTVCVCYSDNGILYSSINALGPQYFQSSIPDEVNQIWETSVNNIIRAKNQWLMLKVGSLKIEKYTAKIGIKNKQTRYESVNHGAEISGNRPIFLPLYFK